MARSRRSTDRSLRALLAAGLLLLACPRPELQEQQKKPLPFSRCPLGEAQGEPGQRVLALVVGISDYADEDVPDLMGAARDAEAFYALLTDPGAREGYGVPVENVCLLVGGEATRADVKRAFEEALTGRAAAGDEAIFYFAGHGAATYDLSRPSSEDERSDFNTERLLDEPDGYDGTLVFWDSTMDPETQLIDDTLAGWIAALQEKTSKVTLLFDACSSGTSARGGTRSRSLPRVRELSSPDAQRPPPQVSDETPRPQGALKPGVLSLAAAEDGTDALEPAVGGHGYFTEALLTALRQASASGATWRTVFRETQDAVVRRSDDAQRPVFQGDDLRVALRPDLGPVHALGQIQRADARRWSEVTVRATGETLVLRLVDAHTRAVLPACTEDRTVLRPGQRWMVQVENRSNKSYFLKGGLYYEDDPPLQELTLPRSALSPQLPANAHTLLDPDTVFVADAAGGPDRHLVVAGREDEALAGHLGDQDIDDARVVTSRMTIQVAEEPALSECTLRETPPRVAVDLEPLILRAASQPPLERLLKAVRDSSLGAVAPIDAAFARACLPPTPPSQPPKGCRPCARAQVGDVLWLAEGKALLIDPEREVVWSGSPVGARFRRLGAEERPETLCCYRHPALAGGPDLGGDECAP